MHAYATNGLFLRWPWHMPCEENTLLQLVIAHRVLHASTADIQGDQVPTAEHAGSAETVRLSAVPQQMPKAHTSFSHIVFETSTIQLS